MRSKILDIAYEKGLYSQGTPDSWDEDALEKFGQYIVDECIAAIERASRTAGATTYDRDMSLGVAAKSIAEIQKIFK